MPRIDIVLYFSVTPILPELVSKSSCETSRWQSILLPYRPVAIVYSDIITYINWTNNQLLGHCYRLPESYRWFPHSGIQKCTLFCRSNAITNTLAKKISSRDLSLQFFWNAVVCSCLLTCLVVSVHHIVFHLLSFTFWLLTL